MAQQSAKSDGPHYVEALRTLYQLWAEENRVKTQKLTTYFTAQSILLTAFNLGPDSRALVAAVGAAFCLVWFFSIGRTMAFQDIWKEKIVSILRVAPISVQAAFDFYPTSQDKKNLPWYGRLSATYVLLWPPAVGFLVWLVALGFAAA